MGLLRWTLLHLLALLLLPLPGYDAYPASFGGRSMALGARPSMGGYSQHLLQRTRDRRRIGPSGLESFVTMYTTTRLRMGLYDRPLPPRPPPVPPQGRKGRDASYDDEDDDDDDDDDDYDDDTIATDNDRTGGVLSGASASVASTNLFEFDAMGREVNGLLPNLGRRLDRGVGCYYEAADRPVASLVRRTACSPSDACWALEACRGDVTEAWTRISVARRMKLEGGRLQKQQQQQQRTDADSNSGEDGGGTYQILDADVLELEMEEEFMELKQQRIEEQKRRDVNDMFRGGDKDQDWLPRQAKGPVDDEPWFTG